MGANLAGRQEDMGRGIQSQPGTLQLGWIKHGTKARRITCLGYASLHLAATGRFPVQWWLPSKYAPIGQGRQERCSKMRKWLDLADIPTVRTFPRRLLSCRI